MTVQVESLVGRTSVADVALGDHHTLFLDGHGSIWTCGENKEVRIADKETLPLPEAVLRLSGFCLNTFLSRCVVACCIRDQGQCGLGTPLEVIAMQHRKAFVDSLRPSQHLSSSSNAASSSSSSGGGLVSSSMAPSRVAGWRPRDQQLSAYLRNLMAQDPQHQRQHKAGMQLFMQRQQQQAGGRATWAGGGGGGASGFGTGMTSGSVASALGWGGFDLEGHLNLSGLQPGQLHTPMRIGRDQHPLSSLLHKQSQEPGECDGHRGGASRHALPNF